MCNACWEITHNQKGFSASCYPDDKAHECVGASRAGTVRKHRHHQLSSLTVWTEAVWRVWISHAVSSTQIWEFLCSPPLKAEPEPVLSGNRKQHLHLLLMSCGATAALGCLCPGWWPLLEAAGGWCCTNNLHPLALVGVTQINYGQPLQRPAAARCLQTGLCDRVLPLRSADVKYDSSLEKNNWTNRSASDWSACGSRRSRLRRMSTSSGTAGTFLEQTRTKCCWIFSHFSFKAQRQTESLTPPASQWKKRRQ